MRRKMKIINRVLSITLVFLISMCNFASTNTDSDGSAFITKAEFDSLKNNFQAQIDQYNQSIDSKIDAAIAGYLAGLRLDTNQYLDNLYEKIESKVAGNKILWTSSTTCTYNKAEYTNIGIKLDVFDHKNNSNDRFLAFNNFAYVWDWPIKNVITNGGFYKETNDKCTIDMVGDEYTWNHYNSGYSGYAGYYPTSDGWGSHLTLGKFVKSIGPKFRLVTNYFDSMNFIYIVSCEVVRDSNSYYLLEPANAEMIYSFDEKEGYKTFDWPPRFKDGTASNYTTLNRSWTEVSSDKSVNDAWKEIDPDYVMTSVLSSDGISSDFDYSANKCRFHKWARSSNIYPWDEVYTGGSSDYATNEFTSGSMTTSYQPGAVYTRNYGENKKVNEIELLAPYTEYGIHTSAKEGMPVLKMAKKGTFEFKVKSDKNGQLVVQNIGEGTAAHTTTTVTTVSLIGGATTAETISGLADADDVIVVKFLPTSTTDQARLTITDTKETTEE